MKPQLSQALFSAIANSWDNTMVWAIDCEMKLTYFNDLTRISFFQMYGQDIAVGTSPLDLIKLDSDREKLRDSYKRVLSGEAHSYIESFGENNDMFFKITYKPLLNQNGSIIGATALSLNVTEFEKTRQKLEKNEFFFRESQQAALIGSYQSEFYPNDCWTTSEVCDTIFGIDDTYDKTVAGWSALLHPDSAEEMIRYVTDDVIGKGIPFDKEYKIIRHSDKETRWVWGLGRTIQDETGRTTGLIGTIQDVTEKKNQENKIKELQSYLSSVMNSMPSILIGTDSNYVIHQWNKKTTQIYQLSEEEAIGKSLSEISTELGALIPLIDEALSRNETTVQQQSQKVNGKIVHQSITIFPVQEEKISRVVIRIDDVTNEVELQKKLNQSQKMDAVGQLAGGIAHDFNNIVAGILGATEILLDRDSGISEENYNFVKLIQDASERAADLTAKLLTFSRQKGEFNSIFTIADCINDTVALLERTIDKRITISVEHSAENQSVLGDASSIQSLLMNLGINASHAMSEGGELQIRTRNVVLDDFYCKKSPFNLVPGEFIEIEVRDNGDGITEENVKRIFEPFFTTKEQGKGTGLGLAAVYGIVQDHKGAITVYSEVGRGTVFHIFLPCSNSHVKTLPDKVNLLPKGQGTILLVDDEEIIRITGKHQLEKMGYTVILAENGKMAVDIFSMNHTSIDLVISDMIMPVMNGHEVFYKIKEIEESVPCIISSGFSKDESLLDLKKDGLAGFIQKPFRQTELLELLEKIFSKD